MGKHRNTGKPLGDHDVGYRKAPVATRFKKGAPSPNPSGRPAGSRNTKTIVTQVLDEKLEITVGGKRRKVSTREALFRKVIADAFQGKPTAVKSAIALAHLYPGKEGKSGADEPLSDADRETLRNMAEIFLKPEARTPIEKEEDDDDKSS